MPHVIDRTNPSTGESFAAAVTAIPGLGVFGQAVGTAITETEKILKAGDDMAQGRVPAPTRQLNLSDAVVTALEAQQIRSALSSFDQKVSKLFLLMRGLVETRNLQLAQSLPDLWNVILRDLEPVPLDIVEAIDLRTSLSTITQAVDFTRRTVEERRGFVDGFVDGLASLFRFVLVSSQELARRIGIAGKGVAEAAGEGLGGLADLFGNIPTVFLVLAGGLLLFGASRLTG